MANPGEIITSHDPPFWIFVTSRSCDKYLLKRVSSSTKGGKERLL